MIEVRGAWRGISLKTCGSPQPDFFLIPLMRARFRRGGKVALAPRVGTISMVNLCLAAGKCTCSWLTVLETGRRSGPGDLTGSCRELGLDWLILRSAACLLLTVPDPVLWHALLDLSFCASRILTGWLGGHPAEFSPEHGCFRWKTLIRGFSQDTGCVGETPRGTVPGLSRCMLSMFVQNFMHQDVVFRTESGNH